MKHWLLLFFLTYYCSIINGQLDFSIMSSFAVSKEKNKINRELVPSLEQGRWIWKNEILNLGNSFGVGFRLRYFNKSNLGFHVSYLYNLGVTDKFYQYTETYYAMNSYRLNQHKVVPGISYRVFINARLAIFVEINSIIGIGNNMINCYLEIANSGKIIKTIRKYESDFELGVGSTLGINYFFGKDKKFFTAAEFQLINNDYTPKKSTLVSNKINDVEIIDQIPIDKRVINYTDSYIQNNKNPDLRRYLKTTYHTSGFVSSLSFGLKF